MQKIFIIAQILLISACSSMQYTPTSEMPIDDSGVSVLYEYPATQYKILGTIVYDFYQPGFNPPTVEDAIPDLKQKAAEIGGNAFIVRDHQRGGAAYAYETFTVEVLLVDKVKTAAKPQDKKVLMHLE